MSELADKLARRRKWEDYRPPPPPPPSSSTGTAETSKTSNGTSSNPHSSTSSRPPPPKVPDRTYRGRNDSWRESQNSTRSLLSLAIDSTSSSIADNTGRSPPSSDGSSRSLAHAGSSRSVGSGGSSSQLMTSTDGGGTFRRPELGKSGSNRHLIKQIEKIESKRSPGKNPLRAPPPPRSSTPSPRGPSRPAPAPPPPTDQTQQRQQHVSKRPPPIPVPQHPAHLGTANKSQPPASPLHSQQIDPKAFDTATNVHQHFKKPLPPPHRLMAKTQMSTKTILALQEMAHLRPALTKFYEIHKKEKIPIIDKILAAYGMNGGAEGEEKLNDALRSEYGADLKSINTSSPSMTTTTATPITMSPVDVSIVEDMGGEDAHPQNLLFCRAKYKFVAEQEGDLEFEIGQIIEVIDATKDWWMGSYKGENKKEFKGIFPKNYVEEISEAFVLSLRAAEESREKSFTKSSPAKATSQHHINLSTKTTAAGTNTSAEHSPLTTTSKTQSHTSPSTPPTAAVAEDDAYSPDLVKDDIYVTHYFKSVLEMVTSEFKYVVDLFLCQKAFAAPFLENMGKEKTDLMMPCWQEILGVHETLFEMLMATLPETASLEKDFGQHANHSSNHISNGGSGPLRRPSYVVDNSDLLVEVAGAKSGKLIQAASKLDALDETYAKLLESGKMLTEQQRQDRVQMISAWVVRQSDVFNKYSPYLKIANPFISNYQSAVETMETLSGEDLQILTKLESNPLLKNLRLRDFLIKPVQRVCKYPLLYREIIKYAPDEDTKLIAMKAQSALMTIADQVNTMMKVNESGNLKKFQEFVKIIRPQTDIELYRLHQDSLRRDGELQVETCIGSAVVAPELKTLQALAAQLRGKPKGSIRGILLKDRLLLVESSHKFLTKAERIRIVHMFDFMSNWESMKLEKIGTAGFSMCLSHAKDGPAKGASITWAFSATPAARDGWVEDLMENADRIDRMQDRLSLARQHEMKTEVQKQAHESKRRSGSIDWDKGKLPSVPLPPTRRKPQNLVSIIEELKNVQSNKFEIARKNIV